MSGTLEAQLLAPADRLIAEALNERPSADPAELRFQILEVVASRFGGFDVQQFRKEFSIRPMIEASSADPIARGVVSAVEASGVPPALAVSALAREALAPAAQRRSGAYHTDFRLARGLAEPLHDRLSARSKVIDPACGAGMLLAALTLVVCGTDRRLAAEWLSESVYAADQSPAALRGCLISLACLTDDLKALQRMRSQWRVHDSLLAGAEAWAADAPAGFDAVIANPPWEKLKLTRHEFLQAEGANRHYGDDYDAFDVRSYESKKAKAVTYADQLGDRYPLLRGGEPDLYVAFAELCHRLTKPGGCIAALLPAGLIRSQSTTPLRVELFDGSSEVSVTVLENRARFFPIDTRFKFVMLHATKRTATGRMKPIQLALSGGAPAGIVRGADVSLGRAELCLLRPDLSLPEVRTAPEWQLFRHLARRGHNWSMTDSPWHPDFVREADMTRDRKHFLTQGRAGAMPLVEGRMVHQHRFGGKGHTSGTGRKAVWSIFQPGESRTQPQFWIEPERLSLRAQARCHRERVGFCDITGQTNERSCLAAIIPPGVVCGNKVPTIVFPNDPSAERLRLWVALANTFVFDWMIRRIITTTINYFHLLSLRLPPLEPDSLPGRQLVEAAEGLIALDRAGASRETDWRMASLRARCDHLVLTSYGLDAEALDVILTDFPLLDRAQPPLPGEDRSTVTRDVIVAGLKSAPQAARAQSRVDAAKAIGAVPYLPSQTANAEADRLAETA